jgi:two-component system response regulator YesN
VHAQGLERNNYYLVLHEHTVAFLHALTDEDINGKRQQKILNVFFEVLLGEVEAGRVQKMHSLSQAGHQAPMASPADFLTHLEQYVQTNLRKHLTLKTAAAAMYFSPTHFSRIMRRETGKSFNEYLAEQRIAEAKELLRKTDYVVTSIATLVGIKSHRYFRTFFKRHTGFTPTEFRSQTLKS